MSAEGASISSASRVGSLSIGVFLVALTTLMVEILLLRVFDVILEAHVGYFVISSAMFALGLAGVIVAVRPPRPDDDTGPALARLAVALALTLVLLRPFLNILPTVYSSIDVRPLRWLLGGGLLYAALVTPFLLSGLILSRIFTALPTRIGRLYFYDLLGAAAGCVIWIPFIDLIGPGGLILWAAGLLLVAAALFSSRASWFLAASVPALALFAAPLLRTGQYFDFLELKNKRGVLQARSEGRIELTKWDPVSKIYVIDSTPIERTLRPAVRKKRVAYDGGSQSSDLYSFDGDYAALRTIVLEGSEPIENHFWRRDLLLSHYLKRDSSARVLVCGSAAGQETKAALLFGASSVVGIELVKAVVDLGKGAYGDYIGGIFRDPRVRNQRGEARSYLRSTSKTFDIIQIFSNHTSSHIASGSNASVPVYLQTVEAYEEYFSHLGPDGLLQVNHHFYPRMVSTAALAWKRLGRSDFQRHVVVYQRAGWDTLPAMLIKMSAWSEAELAEIDEFLHVGVLDSAIPERVVDPVDASASFLDAEFFSADSHAELWDALDYQARPTTDDWPFFSNIQRHFRHVEPTRSRYLDESMAGALNARLVRPGGEYAPFIGFGAVTLVFAVALMVIPLALAEVGRVPWQAKQTGIAYFSCLGLGFISVELVLVQVLLKLIGFPVYAYSVVILAMLLSASLGSLSVGRLSLPTWVPFAAIIILGSLLVTLVHVLIDPVLGSALPIRVATAIAIVFPLGFFMGMPFPLGVLAIRNEPRGAVAWAWGANGVFTVVGGVLTGLVSLWLGFRLTLLCALAVYGVAMLLFARLKGQTAAA
jgi:spermidine synthase